MVSDCRFLIAAFAFAQLLLLHHQHGTVSDWHVTTDYGLNKDVVIAFDIDDYQTISNSSTWASVMGYHG